MTKVNTKCFMWEILARIDRSKFERFTFEENHVGSGLYNYHFGIETGAENVYISIEAFNPMTKEDNNVCTICIKTGDGRINNAVMVNIYGYLWIMGCMLWNMKSEAILNRWYTASR